MQPFEAAPEYIESPTFQAVAEPPVVPEFQAMSEPAVVPEFQAPFEPVPQVVTPVDSPAETKVPDTDRVDDLLRQFRERYGRGSM
jgi:hypothetical protein